MVKIQKALTHKKYKREKSSLPQLSPAVQIPSLDAATVIVSCVSFQKVFAYGTYVYMCSFLSRK